MVSQLSLSWCHRPRKAGTAGMARISAAPVRRAVTAAPGVQPVSSSALANEPESPKTAEEKGNAEARGQKPEAGRQSRPGLAGVVTGVDGRAADTGASCQE